jgi:2-polyprenyl-3-methyl-5-hydroxy-6-metoxy-1,4-benzoquinol methylase
MSYIEKSTVQSFYNNLQFPGIYQVDNLKTLNNPYLLTIDRALNNGQTVLDVGCGTGLITNLFASRYPDSQFTAIDFADSIDFAKKFAKTNQINNVEFIKQDFDQLSTQHRYDVVICQGVLHHMPDYIGAANKLAQLARKTLVVGLYHPWGKLVKKWTRINYGNDILHQDQENHPYEISFTATQVINMFDNLELRYSYPSHINIVSHIEALFNYKNGGLTTYVFNK